MKKLLYLISILVFGFHTSVRMHGTNVNTEDSLLHQLSHAKTTLDSIDIYEKLSVANFDDPKEIEYRNSILRCAKRNNDVINQYTSWGNICRNYYNRKEYDSLLLVQKQIPEPKNEIGKEEYLCTLFFKNSISIEKKNYRLALSEAYDFMNYTREKNSVYGEILALELFTSIYRSTYQHSKAIESIKKGLKLAHQIKGRYPQELIMKLNMTLVEILIEDSQYSEAIAPLQELEVVLSKIKESNDNPPLTKYEWFIYRNLFWCYMADNVIDKAKYYKDLLSTDKYDKYVEADEQYHYLKSLDFHINGDYLNALKEINLQINETPTNIKYIFFKANLLYSLGRYKEANKYYHEALAGVSYNIKENFDRELQQYRQFTGKYESEKFGREKLLALEHTNNQILGSIFLLILTILIIIGFLLRNSHKLKNQLLRTNKDLDQEKVKLKEIESDLEKAVIKAQESNNKKDLFLSTMSHEIRTPLNAIVGFSEIIAEESNNDDCDNQYIDIIRSNSELLLKLVGDIIDVSRLNSEIMSIESSHEDVVDCAQKVVKSMQGIIKGNVTLEMETNEKEIFLYTDKFRLQQILTNLLGNAVKFTPEGKITLSINHTNNVVSFRVTDTGCGVPLEKRNNIFNRFEKLDEKAVGSGLGLYISKHLAEKLGGELFLDTRYTGGASFVLILENNEKVS